MSSLHRLKNRLIAKIITRFPKLSKPLIEAYRPWESEGKIPWTPLGKPLEECRVALITTAGVHHESQPPFDMGDPEGDPSFRELDPTIIGEDFRITHDYYDHSDAEKDLNIVLPLERLREFEKEGIIGKSASVHYGFMGHVTGPHIPTLIGRNAPQVAKRLKSSGVDVAVLIPA